jgi:hypothetical protein
MAMSPAAAGSPTRSSWGAQAVALVLAALATNEVEGEEGELVNALNRLLGWLDPVWTACYGAAGMVCLALLVAVLAVRRLALARDIVLSAAVALGRRAAGPAARGPPDRARERRPAGHGLGRGVAAPHRRYKARPAQRRFVPRCGR